MNAGDMTTPRTLLLLSATGGYELDGFRDAAQRVGARVVLGTNRCHALDDPWHDQALPLRFEDPLGAARAIVAHARVVALDGIVAIGDRTAVIGALAASALGLPHNEPQAVAAARNKYEARRRFAAAGLRGPRFERFAVASEPRDAATTVAYPCVLKPLSLSASRGVIRANNAGELISAWARVAAILALPEVRAMEGDAAHWLLIEDFIPGGEVALEGVLDEGRLHTLALFDKPDPLNGPYFEETLYVTPSRLDPTAQEQIRAEVQAAAAALGLRHGPVHAELRVDATGPCILEVAPRSIGGLCARALRFGAGISLEELIVRHALRLDISGLRREAGASGVMMIPLPHGGVFKEVRGVEDSLRVAGIEGVTLTAKPGQNLLAWPEGSSYLGFIFARAPTPALVEAALRQAHAALHIAISPALPVAR